MNIECFAAKTQKGPVVSHVGIQLTFGPNIQERIARTRADLRMGVPVCLVGRQKALLIPAETLNESRLTRLRQLNQEILLVITEKRAATLKIGAYDGDLVRIIVPPDEGTSWIKAVSDPASDLKNTMKGPFRCKRQGSVELERFALALVKSARLLPSTLIVYPNPAIDLPELDELSILDVERASPHLSDATRLSDIIAANLPITEASTGKLHVFRPNNGSEEHYAMEVGKPARSSPILVRLHSACFTGDVLGSLKCDCGPQLRSALKQMGKIGAGILLYLNQEGRGIGLANKMRAYSLQDEGYDTVEANHRLGFEDDERDFRIGASILKEMGIQSIRLLTNNPAKIMMMEKNGIEVAERVPLIVGKNSVNAGYLHIKAQKSGHLL